MNYLNRGSIMSIKFPISVKSVKVDDLFRDRNSPTSLGGKCGDLVKVRPCAKEYKNKTYLGILLGDLPYGPVVTYNKENGELKVTSYGNPAILVPAVGKIIWGCESWWGHIEKEEDLKDITDKDINNTWYVKAIRERIKKAEKKKKAPAIKKTCTSCKHINRGYLSKICTGCKLNNKDSGKLLWEPSKNAKD